MPQYRYPEFVMGGQLTDAGRKVVAYIEEGIQKAESLVEGQDLAALNAMSGVHKDFWVNVRKAGVVTVEDWVKDRPYGVAAMWDLIMEAEEKANAAQKTDTLEGKLATLESALTEALAKIKTLEAADVDEKTEDEPEPQAEPEPEPAPKRAKKSRKEEAEPPAEPPAEGDAEPEAETE